MQKQSIELLERMSEWLNNIGDGAPDASKTQRMALGYASEIDEWLADIRREHANSQSGE